MIITEHYHLSLSIPHSITRFPLGRTNDILFQPALSKCRWQDAMIQAVCRKLYQSTNARDVDGAFHYFDANDDGVIEFEEFSRSLKNLDVGLDDQQIYQLMSSMDKDRSGTLDIQEFRKRFGLFFQQFSLEVGGVEGSRIANDAAAAVAAVQADMDVEDKGVSAGDKAKTPSTVVGRTRRGSLLPHPANRGRSKMVSFFSLFFFLSLS